MRVHGGVTALAGPVFLQRGDQVFGVLPAQLRHGIGRIHILVGFDAVAAQAGVTQRLAAYGIARCRGRRRNDQTRHRKSQR